MKNMVLLFLLLSVTLYPQQWDWITNSHPLNSNSFAEGYSIATDLEGNVFMGGRILDSVAFGDTMIYSSYTKLLVIKFSPQGKPIWIKQTGGTQNGNGVMGIATDDSGNCFVTGWVNDICNFDTIIVNANGINVAFYLAKINSQGIFEWVKVAGRSLMFANTFGYDVVISKDNDIFVTGTFTYQLYLGNNYLVPYGGSDIFIAKYDQSGDLKWVKQAGSDSYDNSYSLTVDSAGCCYVTGQMSNNCRFGQFTLQGYTPYDGFIAKLDPNGNFLWAKNFGGYQNDGAYSVSYSPFGSIYLTGMTGGTAFFDSTTVPHHGGYDMFIAKYNLDGSLSFAKGFGGTGDDWGRDIFVNDLGNILVTGRFSGTIIFDTTHLYSSGLTDSFVAEFDYDGVLKWVNTYGSIYNDWGVAVTTDKYRNIFACGQLGTSYSVKIPNSSSVFIGKIIDPVTPVELISFTSTYSTPYVHLAWSTATELNNRIFEVERSYDLSLWTCIGFKPGKGTTSNLHQYNYSDDIRGISSFKLYYRLKQIDYNGNFRYSDIVEVDLIPGKAKLFQNFPNPYNASTVIKFLIPKSSQVILKVLNILGEEVRTLVNEQRPSGVYEINFEPGTLPSGVYFCRMQVGDFTETKKLILMK